MDRIHSHQAEDRLRTLFLSGMGGDGQAYRQFLQAMASHLRAWFRRRMSRWPDEVEDLVQETLLALHNQGATYDTAVPLTAWVFAIARYKLIDWLRRHARQGTLHEPLDESNELFSSADAEAQEAQRDLETIMRDLPQQQRNAILHTKVDGWSVRETAATLRISEANVKVAVHRGLKALAARMRKQP